MICYHGLFLHWQGIFHSSNLRTNSSSRLKGYSNIETFTYPSYLLTDTHNVRNGDGGLRCSPLLILGVPFPSNCRIVNKTFWVFIGIQNSVQMFSLLLEHVARLLSSLAGSTESSVRNSKQFVETMAEERLSSDKLLVSFDVSSLFTNVSIQEAVDVICRRLQDDECLCERTALQPIQHCWITGALFPVHLLLFWRSDL